MSIFNTFSLRERRGISIVETLIVIAVAASVVLVITSFGGNLEVLKRIVNDTLQSRSDVEQVLQIMTTEIRSASPSSQGSYAIDSASTSSFVFYSDIDKDGLFERVRYFLASSTIEKGTIKPTGTSSLLYATSSEVVAAVVDNLIFPTSSPPLFLYYDSSYTGSQAALASTTDVTPIRIVQISFYVNIATSTIQPDFFTATVHIRNLKTN